MKILLVGAGAQFSIADVANGYRSALIKQGHEVRDYNLVARLQYHQNALPKEVGADQVQVCKAASENITLEALYYEADYVIIVSGLNVHPIALWSLQKVGIPSAVLFTESPYDDAEQNLWRDLSKVEAKSDVEVFTNDQFSSEAFGWHYLPPAYNPEVHKPVEFSPEDACDVLMIGTGWRERQMFLEEVNWEGIHLRIYGPWMQMTPESPIYKFYRPQVVENKFIAKHYSSAKICLNFHRRSTEAYTPNPRAYEIAACGAFQLSDPRPGLSDMYGSSVPTFSDPQELEHLIRFYLHHEARRKEMAAEAAAKVAGQTFDVRAADLMSVLQDR